jgi:hypothetical protein
MVQTLADLPDGSSTAQILDEVRILSGEDAVNRDCTMAPAAG